MNGFFSSEDVYCPDPSGWSQADWYMCYRFLSRVVVRSPFDPEYRDYLTKLRLTEIDNRILVLLGLNLIEVPAAFALLDPDSKNLILGLKPLDPPLVLDRNHGLANYLRMGVVI